jgi:son of sevenless-like protein
MTAAPAGEYGPKDTTNDESLTVEAFNDNNPTKKDKKAIRPIDTVSVVADYKSDKPNILNLSIGDTVYVLTKTESGWWDGLIFGEDTERGWFPSTYTKAVSSPFSESTPSLQMNATARPPNLSTLLRQTLNGRASPTSRKNSSISFASSDHSIHSEFTNNSGSKSQSIGDPSPNSGVNVKEINLVLPQEIEAMFSSTGSSNVPIWTPVTTNENTIVYYNSELNIYCKQLPYISNPEVDENTKIIVPTLEQDPTPLFDVNLNELTTRQQQQGYRNTVRNRPSTATGYESRKGSAKTRSSVPSYSTALHPWNSSLYCEPDLFYYDPADIKTWSGLREAFNYFLTLTLDALTKQNSSLFHSYFNIASRLGTLINLAARLAQYDLQDSGYRDRVQRRLKKIASSIAQIGINGNLYLTESANRRKSTKSTIRPEDLREGSEVDPKSFQDEELNFQKNSDFLAQVQTRVEILKKTSTSVIKIFTQISSDNSSNSNLLPQVYPRFLTGFFSGGNWRNPFVPNPKDPFAGKEVAKSLHHKRVPRAVLNKSTLANLDKKKVQLKESLSEVLQMLKNLPNTQNRNVEILSKMNRSLTISSKYIDIIEGLDFQVFLNNTTPDFDPSKLIYSILTEFFESKQHLRDIFVSIIMECQNLTVTDPTVFKSIKEDHTDSSNKFANVEPEKTAKLLEAELARYDIENDDGLFVDADKLLVHSILTSFDLLEISRTLVSQLISERDALLSYATRVMDDLQYEFYSGEREDSTMTQEEYALPASATTRLGTKDSDLPWYLDTDEYSLIFTNNDTIKGGTKEALVQRLTHHSVLDASFNYVFLTSFRSMMKTTQLIDMLIKRFNTAPPENLSYEEYTDWVEKVSESIKLRVVNIMKTLLQKYWVPSYNEPRLALIWKPFIDLLVKEEFTGSEQLRKEFEKKVIKEEFKRYEDTYNPLEKQYPSRIKKLKVLDIEADEFANQLTLRDSGLYSKIPQIEFLDKSWNNKYGTLGGFQNLQKFISNSNDLTNFVSTQILSHNDVKTRVNVIKYFVTVAEKCRKLNNFSSMTAIISALYSSPIHRLKKTWKNVPQASYSTLTKMNDLMNSSRNFSEYRELLRTISEKPCVPFLGVFLSDLTFTTNGNPDHLHGDSKLINFAKRTKTVDILREISRYQNLKYNLKKYPDLQDVISYRLTTGLNIDEQYNRSLTIEPRVKVAQQIQGNDPAKGSISSASTVTTQGGKRGKYFPAFPPQ